MMKAAMKVRSMPRPAIEKITVSFDGTWFTRGFSSLYCAGAVIEWESGLVLDYEVLSLYCQVSTIYFTIFYFYTFSRYVLRTSLPETKGNSGMKNTGANV